MPFISHTPESLLPRSDSKNPAITCCGLTSTGRPCRRAIARSPVFSRPQRRTHDPDAYCWQHKDQAAVCARAMPQGSKPAIIQERTSVDTLVDRLGLMEVREGDERRREQKDLMPAGSRQTESISYLTRDLLNHRARHSGRKKAPQSNLSIFCCFGVAEDEMIAPRPVHVREKHSNFTSKEKQFIGQSMQEIRPPRSRPRMLSTRPLVSSHHRASVPDASQSQKRPSLSHSPSSRTAQLLSHIPPTATPQTTALLLVELAKPLSIHDEEGYIYIFWLTPTSLPATPPSETASSLLSPPSSRPTAQNRRRTSEVLQTFSTAGSTNGDADGDITDTRRTILLKIGRASNVQRRLNEWTRQCGHNLSLIRYYPYNPSSPQVSSLPKRARQGIATPSKVPHVHRVERLIHIELAGKRARESGRCESCGSMHREWFEVEASREGVRDVDEVVRRWVAWGFGEGAV